MTITADSIENGNVAVIRVEGRFDYRANRDFRMAMEKSNPDRWVVDLSRTEYMDSSALGMLLVLRESAGGDAGRISITGASAAVRKILDIARFGEIFEIS